MKFFSTLTLMLVAINFRPATLLNSLRVVCYFDYYAPYIEGRAKYTIEDINSTLCTHIVYKSAVLEITNNGQVKIKHPWGNQYNKQFNRFVALKMKNPQLKVMIALEISDELLATAIREKQMSTLLNTTIIDFLSRYRFDGVDLDIRFYQKYFVQMVESFGRQLGPNGYLLSLNSIRNYDVHFFDKNDVSRLSHVDFLNLKTYEFHYPTNQRDQLADHHAPLYNRKSDTKNENNIDSEVNNWISKDFPRNKIVVGIPLYGVGWTLSSSNINPPASANGPGVKGQASDFPGYSAYYEICWNVRRNSWQVFQDPDQLMGPYAVSPYSQAYGRTWIGYDDPAMAIVKSKYIISKNLGGAAVSGIRMDDFQNYCETGRNPMLTAIYNTLKNSSLKPNSEPNLITVPENTAATAKASTQLITYSDNGMANNNNICISSVAAFAIPLVILTFLLVILIYVLAKIFCCQKVTPLNNSEIPLSLTSTGTGRNH